MISFPLPKQMQSKMMDKRRPWLLPTNDCAASDARRIEGRPGTALRPSSERLEGITLKCGALAIDSKVVSSGEDSFRNLSDDILEYILAWLPLFSLMAVKKVCKRWASVISTPEFNMLRKELNHKPCLLQCGMCNWFIGESECFAYDVENDAWVTLSALQYPAHNIGSLTGASGVIFAIAGPGKDRLLYKLTSSASSVESFGETWYETPVMTFPRSAPVVSVSLGAGVGHKVVVAGWGLVFWGALRRSERHRAVEVFDSEIGTWESYGDLPMEFERANSWTSMSGVVCDNKFYVSNLWLPDPYDADAEIYVLDLYTKQWAFLELETPDDLIYRHIMAIGTTLVVAGFFNHSDDEILTVKLWKVDLKTVSKIRIGLMPSDLAALIKDPPNRVPFKVLVDENLVYFTLEDGNIVVGEVSLEECKTCWRLLPARPATRCLITNAGFTTCCASITSA